MFWPPVYEQTKGRDGFVSLEVSPYLARDEAGTAHEAKRLWADVNAPNLMIKIPATPQSIPAIRQSIAAGINVNVTLIFSLAAYADVVEAWLSGLEDLKARGGDLSRVASVASFFVSRIDGKIDAAIDQRTKAADKDAEHLKSLRGKGCHSQRQNGLCLLAEHHADPRAGKALEEAGAQTPAPAMGFPPAPRTKPIAMCCTWTRL
jgi:transaldolase/glucose-6-phosphate isomerase